MRAVASMRAALLAVALAAGASVSGCGGGGGSGTPPPAGSAGPTAAIPAPTTMTLKVRVGDVNGRAIAGASVTVTAAGTTRQATIGADGSAVFPDLPVGPVDFSASAAGFDSPTRSSTFRPTYALLQRDGSNQEARLTLISSREWSVGRAILLGTRMVERASDGSAMTFSVDIAVIDENSEAIQTLTAADFSVIAIDCGWGGPRDCASDAAGNATGISGLFEPEGGAQSFGLQPPAARRPYLVGVLAERSADVRDWDQRVPALKSFFTALGGNDSASLASVQTEGGSATLKVLGLFTSNGRSYFDAIDQLAQLAGSPPAILDSLSETIRRTAAARDDGNRGAEAGVLVMSEQGLSVSDIDAATALAQRLRVRISTIGRESFGLPEISVRTGGLAAEIDDPRQLGMVFSAMDRLLAGTTPHYRMQFRIKGLKAATFVAGGNAKVRLRVRVPSPIPNIGVNATLDVAIP